MSTPRISLRPVTADDCELLLDWVNDPEVRRVSFSSAPIGGDEHRAWFERKLVDRSCIIYVVIDPKAEPVGQIRFDLQGESEAVISLSIAAPRRGRGLGTEAIRLGTAEATRSARLSAVHAYIKPENAGSLRAFAAAGYAPPKRVTYRGTAALRMTWTGDETGSV